MGKHTISGHRVVALVVTVTAQPASAQSCPRCARSISASRSRPPTSCIPRPMWRRSSAFSPSAASNPRSCSSKAAVGNVRCRCCARLGDRERQRRRRRPRPEGAAVLGPRPAHAAGLHGVPGIKTAADLKGKKLSATGGGVGGFNWRMGREMLKSAGLSVDDAQFIPAATAGRLPGLIAGQITASRFIPRMSTSPGSRSRRSMSWFSLPT